MPIRHQWSTGSAQPSALTLPNETNEGIAGVLPSHARRVPNGQSSGPRSQAQDGPNVGAYACFVVAFAMAI
jgi:hypothetical protein